MIMLVWIIVFSIIIYIVFQGIRLKYYFKRYGIPHPSEVPFIGSAGADVLLRNHPSKVVTKLYDSFNGAKYIGCHMFSTPLIIVFDRELLKSVLVKNFDSFAYHKTFVDDQIDPLFGKNLAFLNGERWRDVRSILSPSFTSSKMRSMHTLMSRCAEKFVSHFVETYRNEENIDIKDAFTRFANDVIATCAFGLEINSLKDRENEFYIRGRRTSKFDGLVLAKFFLLRAFPSLGHKWGIRIISKEDTDFFVNVIKSTIKMREEKNIARPDMLQLMIEAKEKGGMDLLEITAQAFIFFLGGFETTSAQMCMIAYELMMNPEVQRKLQDEIDSIMTDCNGSPTYEAINNMAYLDAVFSETMRKHSLPFLSRVCSKDFEFPPALPHLKPFTVKKGMELLIPVVSVHYDSEVYENPKKFNPERFLHKKAAATDVTSLGFGLGPRMCIGNRFAILETKVLFVHLLAKCTLLPCKKTCVPLVYDASSFSPSPKGGSWLKFELRD